MAFQIHTTPPSLPKAERICKSLEGAQVRSRNVYLQEKARLEKRLTDLRRRMDECYTDKLDGVIPEDLWKRKMSEWQADQQRIQLEISELNCSIDTVSVTPTYRKPFDTICKRVKSEQWSALEDDFGTFSPPDHGRRLRSLLWLRDSVRMVQKECHNLFEGLFANIHGSVNTFARL